MVRIRMKLKSSCRRARLWTCTNLLNVIDFIFTVGKITTTIIAVVFVRVLV